MFQRQNVVHVDLANDDPQTLSGSSSRGRSKHTAIEISDTSSNKRLEVKRGNNESTPSIRGMNFWSRPYFGFGSTSPQTTSKTTQTGHMGSPATGRPTEKTVIDLSQDDEDLPCKVANVRKVFVPMRISASETKVQKVSTVANSKKIRQKRPHGDDDDDAGGSQPAAKRPALDKHIPGNQQAPQSVDQPSSVVSTAERPTAKTERFRKLVEVKKSGLAHVAKPIASTQHSKEINAEPSSTCETRLTDHALDAAAIASTFGRRKLRIANLAPATTKEALKEFLQNYRVYVVIHCYQGGSAENLTRKLPVRISRCR